MTVADHKLSPNGCIYQTFSFGDNKKNVTLRKLDKRTYTKQYTMKGYQVKQHAVPVKRYCRTMELKPDDALIREYVHRHSESESWPEILQGIRSVGILEMEIYLLGNRLFMIVETPVDFDWDSAMARLATLPRQQEWEDFMAIFQQCREGDTADEKWKMMDRIFFLYDK